MSITAKALRGICVLLGLAGAALAWAVLLWAADELTPVQRLDHLTISPDAHAPVILGRDVLLQGKAGAAAPQHLAVIRDGRAILAYDISPSRRVGYFTDGVYEQTSRVPLPDGKSVLAVGPARWDVLVAGDQAQLTNAETGAEITLTSGRMIHKMGRQVNETPGSDLERAWLRGQALLRGPALRASLGGAVAPGDVQNAMNAGILPDRRLPFGAARLELTSGGWRVARGRVPVRVQADGVWRDAEAHPIVLVDDQGAPGADRIVLGRTHYRVTPVGTPPEALTLTPERRHVWVAPDAVDPVADARIARKPTQAAPRLDTEALAQAALIGFGLVLCLMICRRLPGQQDGAAAGLAVAGLVMTLLQDGVLATTVAALGAGLVAMALVSVLLSSGRRALWSSILAIAGAVCLAAGPALPSDVARPEIALAGAWLGLIAPFCAPQLRPAGAFFWALVVIVATLGAAAAARLVSLEPTEAWSTLLGKHLVALAAIGVVAAVGLAATHRASWPSAQMRRALLPKAPRLWSLMLMAGLGSGFAAVTLLGTETGFYGLFQPSEFAKSLLAILVAATVSLDLARRQMLTAQDGGLTIWPAIVAGVMAIAIAGASALNYDMSPILVSGAAILAALAAGAALHIVQLGLQRRARRVAGMPITQAPRAALAWASAPLRRRRQRMLVRWSRFWPVGLFLVLCGAAVLGSWLVMPKNFEQGAAFEGPSFMVTPWKRVQSYLDMRPSAPSTVIAMPETGTQLRLGREAILEAPCRLGASLICRNAGRGTPDMATAALLRVPAVQDDFASVSLIHALGVDGAVIYAALQMALVAFALSIGVSALFAPSEFRIGAWLVGSATIGLSTLVAAQILLAWGNALGFLPIMGQPMTFVSLGASHHLGVALPFALVTLLATHATGRPRSSDRDIRHLIFRRRAVS